MLVCSIDWSIGFVAMEQLRGNIYRLTLDSTSFYMHLFFSTSYNRVSTFSNNFLGSYPCKLNENIQKNIYIRRNHTTKVYFKKNILYKIIGICFLPIFAAGPCFMLVVILLFYWYLMKCWCEWSVLLFFELQRGQISCKWSLDVLYIMT